MLSLIKKPLTAVIWHHHKVKIDLAFDKVIRYLNCLDDDELSKEEQIEIAVELFLGKKDPQGSFVLPKEVNDEKFLINVIKIINKEIFKDPYGHWKDPDAIGADAENDVVKTLDYTLDADAIYSSFLQQYGIDLIEQQGKLHWNKFKALLDGLNQKTYVGMLRQIRTETVDNDMSAERKNEIINTQHYYAIEDPYSEKRKAKIFNGKSLTRFFGISKKGDGK